MAWNPLERMAGPNRKHLEKYHRHLQLQTHLKERTVQTKLWRVYEFLKAVDKDAASITRDEVEQWLLERKKKVQPVTLQGEILEVRLFFRWMAPAREKELFPGKMKRVKTRLPMDRLLSRKDMEALVEACGNQRDRAFLMILWDSGCRIGEIMQLKVGDVVFDRYGAVVIVEGKTGRRRLRLTSSVPDLQAWVNVHPLRKDPSAPLWTTHRRYGSTVRALDDQTVRNTLKAIARRAGISGRIYPHLVRHARLTDLARSDGKKKGLNEMELRIVAGWERSSVMPATYLHLSGADVEKRILENAGITEETGEPDTTLEAVRCPRCKALNTSGARFCQGCSMTLTEEAARQIDDTSVQVHELFAENPEAQVIFARLLKELKK